MKRCRLAVLVSGSGTNLQAILDASVKNDFPAEVQIVISNRTEAFALERARTKNIKAIAVSHKDFSSREEFENELIRLIDAEKVDLVVLAGFMRILSPHFLKHYPERVINIHPALLPAFPGTHAIQQAWDYGVKVTGVTVHFVDEGTDTGPVILQQSILMDSKETLESLEKKVHSVEHSLYLEAIQLFAEGKLQRMGRRVLIKD